MKLTILGVLLISVISFSNNSNNTKGIKEVAATTENQKNTEEENIPVKTAKPRFMKKVENITKKTSWELVWRDEFDGEALDRTKWNYWENNNPWNSGNYVNEKGELVDQYGFRVKHYYLRDNVKIKEGNLVIELKKETDKTVKINGKDRKILYSSGAVHTKGLFTVHEGKIEMRAAMPKGVGVWPAFWTWPADYSQATGSPAKEEIDIVETYGDRPNLVTGTAHALKADNKYASFTGKDLKLRKSEDLTNFNIYAVEWNEKEIKWYFNGRHYKTLSMKKVKKQTDNTFKLPHFLMINVALQNKTGEDGDIHFPTEMKVDYVRVYKKQ